MSHKRRMGETLMGCVEASRAVSLGSAPPSRRCGCGAVLAAPQPAPPLSLATPRGTRARAAPVPRQAHSSSSHVGHPLLVARRRPRRRRPLGRALLLVDPRPPGDPPRTRGPHQGESLASSSSSQALPLPGCASESAHRDPTADDRVPLFSPLAASFRFIATSSLSRNLVSRSLMLGIIIVHSRSATSVRLLDSCPGGELALWSGLDC